MTWYRPFDKSCTSGTGVFGVVRTRTGVSEALDAVRKSESSAL
jgi:hypothetical protein